MNILKKAQILGEAGKFDSCGPKQCEIKVKNNLKGLYHAESENKNCIMLKTLMTNKCEFDCKYCPNSTTSKKQQKATYTPEELERVFNSAKQKLNLNGLFLSSGLTQNTENTMENMLDATERIRKTFKGYIHLKIMPGTPREYIKRAAELANRVSINIETPNEGALNEISTTKNFKIDILRRQAWIKQLKKSQSTQMIITKQETDKELLQMTNWQYNTMELKRVYYSAFTPVKGTKLEHREAETQKRQNKLYKADFLIKEYKYKIKEITNIMTEGMLPEEDPKIALAKQHFNGRADINETTHEDLIRIPGIGLITAQRILAKRKQQKITTYTELKKLGANTKRAAPYIEINGKKQLTLTNY